MADILHLIRINAPREKVYEAIATADGVRNWWTRDTDLEPKVGGAGEFRFHGGQRITRVKIEELKPPARVVWKTLSAPIPTWADSVISLDLQADGGGTVLRFAQRGIRQADDQFAMSTTAWGSFLLSLKEYLETGKGTPHPDDPLSRTAKPK